jgi:hypothetical protein
MLCPTCSWKLLLNQGPAISQQFLLPRRKKQERLRKTSRTFIPPSFPWSFTHLPPRLLKRKRKRKRKKELFLLSPFLHEMNPSKAARRSLPTLELRLAIFSLRLQHYGLL